MRLPFFEDILIRIGAVEAENTENIHYICIIYALKIIQYTLYIFLFAETYFPPCMHMLLKLKKIYMTILP